MLRDLSSHLLQFPSRACALQARFDGKVIHIVINRISHEQYVSAACTSIHLQGRVLRTARASTASSARSCIQIFAVPGATAIMTV